MLHSEVPPFRNLQEDPVFDEPCEPIQHKQNQQSTRMGVAVVGNSTSKSVHGHPVAISQMQIERSPETLASESEGTRYFQYPTKGEDHHDDIEMNISSLTKGEPQKAGAKCFDDDVPMKVQTDQSKFIPLGEDVYSLIFICPFNSLAFLFALYTHILKMILMSLLLSDLFQENKTGTFGGKTCTVAATQFFLLPVAVALQDDLIKVYMRVSNMSYDAAILKDLPSAHKSKLFLSYFLQFLDGLASLSVNFLVMMKTDNIQGIFLNFAALHFLQSIDNAAFSLAGSGFLVKSIEEYCGIVKSTALPQRVSNFSTNHLDTILFTVTYGILFILYFVATFVKE